MLQSFRDLARAGVGLALAALLASPMVGPLRLTHWYSFLGVACVMWTFWMIAEVVARSTRNAIERERGDRQ